MSVLSRGRLSKFSPSSLSAKHSKFPIRKLEESKAFSIIENGFRDFLYKSLYLSLREISPMNDKAPNFIKNTYVGFHSIFDPASIENLSTIDFLALFEISEYKDSFNFDG